MPKKKTSEKSNKNTSNKTDQADPNSAETKKESWFTRFLHSDGRHILTIGFLSGFVSCAVVISLAILILFPDLSFSGNDSSRASLENAGNSTLTSDSAMDQSEIQEQEIKRDQNSSLSENFSSSDLSQSSLSEDSSVEQSSAAGGAEKYIRNDLLWTGRQGYLLGTYLPAYPMNLRMEPLTDADEAGQIQALEPLNIVEITEGLEESVWGRTDKGPWILLQDKETLYCFGPGEYEAIDPLAIFNKSNEEVSHFRSQQHFFADQIFTQSGAIYGVLSDGNQVILWNQVSTVER